MPRMRAAAPLSFGGPDLIGLSCCSRPGRAIGTCAHRRLETARDAATSRPEVGGDRRRARRLGGTYPRGLLIQPRLRAALCRGPVPHSMEPTVDCPARGSFVKLHTNRLDWEDFVQ